MNTLRSSAGVAALPQWLLQAPRSNVPDGHFDELYATATLSPPTSDLGTATHTPLAAHWGEFFEHLGPHQGAAQMDALSASLARQIRDNGVTYNIYSDSDGPQRPWALDLFPLILNSADWQQIEAGVLQRMRLLQWVLTDIYGAQTLLQRALLPPALVQGHPGYLRAMHGARLPAGMHLHIAAFDLARSPQGDWRLVSQRTQAPSGLGYLLENRLVISRLFPKAFAGMGVQRLAATYRALMHGLRQMSPAGADAHIALLTPGPYNETYFEHAYLARYLGLSLVQGSDLTVRREQLFRKTLSGLEPVHGLIKRLDDEFLDPLELRADSTLGVPGLLQAVRAGHVLMANAPGTAFLESPALLGFLPALAQQLLGQDLLLPALPTWWCGEQAALAQALPDLARCVIKPTYPAARNHHSFEPVLGQQLSGEQLQNWAQRLTLQGDEHTLQHALALSHLPAWQAGAGTNAAAPGHMTHRPLMLRVFAVSDSAQSWRVLPGGLVRLAGPGQGVASMQRGGSSADAWVLVNRARGEQVDATTLLAPSDMPSAAAQGMRKGTISSRAAENLFWLGRYSERAESTVRLALLALESLSGEHQSALPLLNWLDALARAATLVPTGTAAAQQGSGTFTQALIQHLGPSAQGTSVAFNLRALHSAAAAVRERLSLQHWSLIVRADEEFVRDGARAQAGGEISLVAAVAALDKASRRLVAITGAQTDRMTRDDGWRLLSIGRHLERLTFLAQALLHALDAQALSDEGGFEAVLALFDSTITFRAHYQQSRNLAALLELLVLHRDNPRSLAWVVHTLRGRLSKLAGCAANEVSPLAQQLPDPSTWQLGPLCQHDEQRQLPALRALLMQCTQCAWRLSEDISARYFSHTDLNPIKQEA